MTLWPVIVDRGTAQELHDRSAERFQHLAEEAGGRLAVVHQAVQGAVVLGSTQPDAVLSPEACARAGVQVARRRSGGGAVLVQPGALVWVDLLLAADDPLWSPDVGRAMWWLGEAWAAALARAGCPEAMPWRGPLQHRPWSSLVCFAGLGPGEVTIDGRKVVGISQRRGRAGALFQSACLLDWSPGQLVDLLALDDKDRRQCLAQVAPTAAGAGPARGELLTEALLAGLP